MTPLRRALADYLAMRRALGYRLARAEKLLAQFLAYLEDRGETRLRTEALLAAGKVEEAEAYMEQRRMMMLDHGYRIRKINQAFFAFHGSYAASPASISPIHGQLEKLRQRSGSLGEFLHTVAGFGSYQEFLDYLENDGR